MHTDTVQLDKHTCIRRVKVSAKEDFTQHLGTYKQIHNMNLTQNTSKADEENNSPYLQK